MQFEKTDFGYLFSYVDAFEKSEIIAHFQGMLHIPVTSTAHRNEYMVTVHGHVKEQRHLDMIMERLRRYREHTRDLSHVGIW